MPPAPPARALALVLVLVLALAPVLATACGSRSGLALPELAPEFEAPLCVVLPPDGRLTVDLSTEARVRRADVFMLLDTTSSMEEELARIAGRLRRDIAPEIFATIPDTEFGVGIFADFPLEAYGYGASTDSVYELRLPMTGDLLAVQNALDGLPLQDGLDPWEAQIEALYQVATGSGLGEYIEASLGCPSGGFGGPCFRRDAQPIVLLFTDAPFHGGPASGMQPQSSYADGVLEPSPHSYTVTMQEFLTQRIRLVGLWSGDDARARRDLELAVQDTGSVGPDGTPIVFDIGSDGSSLGGGVVSALRDLAGSLVYDVDAFASDPVAGDGFDTATLVLDIVPLEARPMTGVSGVDRARSMFLDVSAGTTLIYEVNIVADAPTPGPEPQRFMIRIHFRGDGATDLGARDLTVVVPSVDGRGCETPGQ